MTSFIQVERRSGWQVTRFRVEFSENRPSENRFRAQVRSNQEEERGAKTFAPLSFFDPTFLISGFYYGEQLGFASPGVP